MIVNLHSNFATWEKHILRLSINHSFRAVSALKLGMSCSCFEYVIAFWFAPFFTFLLPQVWKLRKPPPTAKENLKRSNTIISYCMQIFFFFLPSLPHCCRYLFQLMSLAKWWNFYVPLQLVVNPSHGEEVNVDACLCFCSFFSALPGNIAWEGVNGYRAEKKSPF